MGCSCGKNKSNKINYVKNQNTIKTQSYINYNNIINNSSIINVQSTSLLEDKMNQIKRKRREAIIKRLGHQ